MDNLNLRLDLRLDGRRQHVERHGQRRDRNAAVHRAFHRGLLTLIHPSAALIVCRESVGKLPWRTRHIARPPSRRGYARPGSPLGPGSGIVSGFKVPQ